MADIGYRFVSFGGLLAMIGLAYALSENRRAISLRVVLWGLALQLALVLIVLYTAPGRWCFTAAEGVFGQILAFSTEGARFVFGGLVDSQSLGPILAFQVLPVIIFMASLAAVLYHLHVIQKVVGAMAWVMQRTMRISGAESLSAALFVFTGIESVPAIGRYVPAMTRSELFVVMTAFLATIATSVMAIYVSFGASAGHLLAASLMSAPAAVVVAKLMVPETGTPVTAGLVKFEPEVTTVNVVDAAATGAAQGVVLILNIAAMLLAFVAMVALVNFVLERLSGYTLQQVLGWGFSGFAAAMGVPKGEWLTVGELLGTKTVVNEFFAYKRMQEMVSAGMLSPRAVIISTYALCGFSNFGSIGILIGGLSGVAPERRGEVAALGIKALVAGTLACFMTACYAGMLA
jgi:CNT family concentrative nucleoside transporter